MGGGHRIKSVAVIGAGAAGAITAAALKAEDAFDVIRVFERRATPGGTWIYDAAPRHLPVQPGRLPPDVDPPLDIPERLPRITQPSHQQRFSQTPIYESLTQVPPQDPWPSRLTPCSTNVPDIAMSFSDARFAYGPFTPHHVPRQYIENYFSLHKTDAFLVLDTTVEDLSRIPDPAGEGLDRWKLTLRRFDPVRDVDIWWEEVFDAVILGNGHYSVPYVPRVKGLDEYLVNFPGRVVHSKSYRAPQIYTSKKVVVVGNSASGHDVAAELVETASLPVYQSRRSKSRWDGESPPLGMAWKPVIEEYLPDGRILFTDGTYLDDVDTVIYCTGYQPSYPFWKSESNGRTLWDYERGKLVKSYWHTFFHDFKTLGIVGVPRVLTFRSFEYQAIALARLFAGRNAISLPPVKEQERWEAQRVEYCRKEGLKFHDVAWETGETKNWLDGLFRIAGLGTLGGQGRIPPVLGRELVWAVEHIKKYPEPGKETGRERKEMPERSVTKDWVVVEARKRDVLGFL